MIGDSPALADREPLPGLRVVADGAALHLEREDAVVGVGEDEVGLTLLGPSLLAGELPGDRVESDELVGRLVAQALEEAPLSGAVGLDRRLRDHARHALTLSAEDRLFSS